VAKKNRNDGKKEDLIRLDIRVLYRPVKKSEVSIYEKLFPQLQSDQHVRPGHYKK
jgi:hypothetical protein